MEPEVAAGTSMLFAGRGGRLWTARIIYHVSHHEDHVLVVEISIVFAGVYF